VCPENAGRVPYDMAESDLWRMGVLWQGGRSSCRAARDLGRPGRVVDTCSVPA
jgi:hypothetical protein